MKKCFVVMGFLGMSSRNAAPGRHGSGITLQEKAINGVDDGSGVDLMEILRAEGMSERFGELHSGSTWVGIAV